METNKMEGKMMDTGLAATASAISVNGIVREQICLLYTEHQLSAEQISEQLKVPLVIVIEVLEKRLNGATATRGEPTESATDFERDLTERLDGARMVERGLDEYVGDAIKTLGQLVSCGDSDGIKLTASVKLLEMRSGGLRPRRTEQQKSGGVALTEEALGKLLAIANSAYMAQLPTAKVSEVSAASETVGNNSNNKV